MISEEKVKIMTEMARYEKEYGNEDFRINQYTENDYICLETMKMSVAITVAFFGIMGLLCFFQLDVIITSLREGNFITPLALIMVMYMVGFLLYLHFIRNRAVKHYQEVEARIKIYDNYLENLMKLYEEKENEDVSPTIAPEEENDGQNINL